MKKIAPGLLVLLFVSSAGVCRADSQDDKAAAQAAYDLGRKLSLAGNFAEACPKFEESQKLDPGLGTMLFLADCYEKTGKSASAWGEFREAEAIASKQGDNREKVAHDRAAALEPKLSKITIKVDFQNKISGLRVTRDRVEIGQGVWNTPLPIDPGPHEIGASAKGYTGWSEHVEIAATGATTIVVVPKLLEDPDAVVAVGAAAPLQTPPPERPAPDTTRKEDDGRTQRLLGLGAAGVGVVAAGVGTFFGLRASSKLSDSNANDHCPNGGNLCDQTGVDARTAAKSAATISTISFVASGLLIAGGAVVYFTAPHAQTITAHVAPAVGPKSAGLELGASW